MPRSKENTAVFATIRCLEICRWSPQGCESDAADAKRAGEEEEEEEVEPAYTADNIETGVGDRSIAASTTSDKRYLA